jgi:phosphoglycerate dehydrogenase-like enzyme
MTFKVDNDALKVAMMRHYEEKLAKELREMFIFAGNEDANRIWQLYMEEVQQREKREEEREKTIANLYLIIVGLGMIGYGIYRLWTSS